MKQRALLLSLLLLGSSLTRCALTDHYALTSDGTSGMAGTATLGGGTGAGAQGGEGGASTVSFGGTSAGARGGEGGASTVSSGGTAGGGDAQAGSGGSSQDRMCSQPCSELQECCAGRCAETTIDVQNCGRCGNVCNAGRECAAGACTAGWVSMAPPPTGFVGRIQAATVAMGKSVFIWGGRNNGGVLDTGAIYSPATDSWVLVNQTGAPPARSLATAVWTGKVVIVFGGVDGSTTNLLKDAYAYEPNAKTWTALPPAATRRSRALGLWDGTHSIFWGGTDANNAPIAGADRYDLTNWTTSSTAGDPGPLLGPAMGFAGATLYLQGGLLNGNTRQDKVFSYSTALDAWAALSTGLPARSNAFGVWDGSSHFVVWGGRDDAKVLGDGKHQSGSIWTAMNATGAPSARMLFWLRSGWAFAVRPGVVAILGGETSLAGNGTFSTNGATFNVTANTWKAIADWPSGETHDYGVGVWTGEELILWSGYDQVVAAGQMGNATITGERLSF